MANTVVLSDANTILLYDANTIYLTLDETTPTETAGPTGAGAARAVDLLALQLRREDEELMVLT